MQTTSSAQEFACARCEYERAAAEDSRAPTAWEKTRMTIEDIRKRLADRFVPFTIRTSDGETFHVPHREFIMLTPKRVVVADARGYVDILDPLHIVSIEEAGELPTN